MSAPMIKVKCNQRPIRDILTRQPKQPGQKKALWNVVTTEGAPTEIVWANRCKVPKGVEPDYRCTRCGQKGHEEV